MLKVSLLLATLLLAGWATSSPTKSTGVKSYAGYKVFTVTLTPSQKDLLSQLETKITIDMWKEPHRVGPKNSKMAPLYRTEFMVSAADSVAAIAFFQAHSIRYEVKFANVQSLIDTEREQMRAADAAREALKATGAEVKAIDWTKYYRSPDIYDWLDEVVAANSDIASMTTVGQTTQGRDIKLVKISKAGSPANKPAVLVDGAFHAREWISPAIVTWFINDLLTNRAANADALDALDFYFIPLVNVDGYEYSHDSERMWRKTRSDHNSALGCMGVDPNRNSGFHFGGGGTSNDKCSDIYRGPFEFSEPEVAALRDVVEDTGANWLAYFTVHSYGLMWLTPWSWTYDHPSDTIDLVGFGQVGADAINAVAGTRFDVGESSEVYGITAGSSDDWAHGVANVKYSQTIEVDNGSNGFQTPANRIIPIAKETWEGIKASTMSRAK